MVTIISVKHAYCHMCEHANFLKLVSFHEASYRVTRNIFHNLVLKSVMNSENYKSNNYIIIEYKIQDGCFYT